MDLKQKTLERLSECNAKIDEAITYFGRGDYDNAIRVGEEAKGFLERGIKYIQTAEDADDEREDDLLTSEEIAAEALEGEAVETGDGEPD